MENYKEKYDNLVETLKSARNDKEKSGYTFKSIIDSILPELCESEGDRIRKELISFFTKRDEFSKSEPFDGLSNKQIITWLEKQKPAEWSEEDEIKHRALINTLKGKGSCFTTNDFITWLQSFKPQSKQEEKQERTDEDKKYIKSICFVIDEAANRCIKRKGKVNGISYDEMLNWLKSLKPHWKPSEKEIRGLSSLPNFEYSMEY